jgi:hypothetical protein
MEDAEDMMATYQFPYLDPHQSRLHQPTTWQQELANAIEGVFAKGALELDELVEGLNGSRVRPPNGGDWTEDNLRSVLRELGA